MAAHIRVVRGDDGVGSGLLRREPVEDDINKQFLHFTSSLHLIRSSLFKKNTCLAYYADQKLITNHYVQNRKTIPFK